MEGITIYAHYRNDTNSIFYIGIGKGNRPFELKNRNKYWQNIVNKHGYRVEIIASELDKDDAVFFESLLISIYGRKDIGTGCLINMTAGGDGVRDWIPSIQWKEKQSISKKGKPRSEDIKIKISESKKNIPNFKIRGELHYSYGKKRPEISSKQYKKCVNIENGEIVDSVIELSKLLNIKYSTLTAKLNNKRKKQFNWKYL